MSDERRYVSIYRLFDHIKKISIIVFVPLYIVMRMTYACVCICVRERERERSGKSQCNKIPAKENDRGKMEARDATWKRP